MKDTLRFGCGLVLFILRGAAALVYTTVFAIPLMVLVGMHKKGRKGPLLWFTRVFPSPQEILGISHGQMFGPHGFFRGKTDGSTGKDM